MNALRKKKDMKIVNEGSLFSGRDSNRATPEYEPTNVPLCQPVRFNDDDDDDDDFPICLTFNEMQGKHFLIA
jgi:hypothetical protein